MDNIMFYVTWLVRYRKITPLCLIDLRHTESESTASAFCSDAQLPIFIDIAHNEQKCDDTNSIFGFPPFLGRVR